MAEPDASFWIPSLISCSGGAYLGRPFLIYCVSSLISNASRHAFPGTPSALSGVAVFFVAAPHQVQMDRSASQFALQPMRGPSIWLWGFAPSVAVLLAEGGGRAHKRGFAQIHKVRLQLRSGETRIDLRIRLIDHLRRRVSGCANAEPRANLVAWHKLGSTASGAASRKNCHAPAQ